MFSPQTRHYFNQAQGYGQLDRPTHQGQAGSREHGHFFELQLQVAPNGVITALVFHCPRCVPAVACGAYLQEALVGQTTSQAAQLTSQQVLEALGGLPLQRSFYAWMVVQALQNALGGIS